jgi:hypothetical protein
LCQIGKLKTTHINRITKIDWKSTTSALEIANELADQFAKTTFKGNYTLGLRMKKRRVTKSKRYTSTMETKNPSTFHSQTRSLMNLYIRMLGIIPKLR